MVLGPLNIFLFITLLCGLHSSEAFQLLSRGHLVGDLLDSVPFGLSGFSPSLVLYTLIGSLVYNQSGVLESCMYAALNLLCGN